MWDMLRLKGGVCLETERFRLVGSCVEGWELVRYVLESRQESDHKRPHAPAKNS